jgi:hypothetical protein
MKATLTITVWVSLLSGVQAQRLSAPTPGIPRLPDGRPHLVAAVPHAPDGRPDLSGVWRRAASEPPRGSNLAYLTLTVDDVKAYTRPWSVTVALELVPDTDLLEFICDNNKYSLLR